MNGKTSRKPFAKRSFGQNFLVDPYYIEKIVGALYITDTDAVVEIGSGRGALTENLIERAKKVFAIELDRDLLPILAARFGTFPNFELIDADALSFDFSSLGSAAAQKKLVANLPYNISTPILQHLIGHRFAFSEMVLMFQREVVARITAKPGSKERGFLTVLVEAAFKAEKLFDVPGRAFKPAPAVTSSVIRLVPIDTGEYDARIFRNVISRGFAQKRKTLANNFRSIYPDAVQLMQECGIDAGRRAETLELHEWIAFTRAVEARSK